MLNLRLKGVAKSYSIVLLVRSKTLPCKRGSKYKLFFMDTGQYNCDLMIFKVTKSNVI